MVDILDFIGSITFMLSGVPQAIFSYKQGHSRGLDRRFLWLWFIGEISFLISFTIDFRSLWIVMNYIVGTLCVLIVMRYSYFERK